MGSKCSKRHVYDEEPTAMVKQPATRPNPAAITAASTPPAADAKTPTDSDEFGAWLAPHLNAAGDAVGLDEFEGFFGGGLGLGLGGVEPYVLLWKLRCTAAPWTAGVEELRAGFAVHGLRPSLARPDAIKAAVKTKMREWVAELRGAAGPQREPFKEFYTFVWRFSRASATATVVPFDDIRDVWLGVLTECAGGWVRFPPARLMSHLEAKGARPVPADVWQQAARFVATVGPRGEGYTDDLCFPTVLEELGETASAA